MLDTKNGAGELAHCGQKATINLRAISANEVLYEKKELSNTVSNFDIKALNIGIPGMREGGTRAIVVPKSALGRLSTIADYSSEMPVEYVVELVKVTPSYPKELQSTMVFTDAINNKKAAMCGDKVEVLYKVRDLNGNLVQTGKKRFKIGEQKVPIVFELNVIEMQPEVKRTIITHAGSSAIGDKGLDMKLSKDHANIIEMKLVSIN